MSTLAVIRSNIRTTYLKIDPNGKVWADNTVDYYANRGYTKVQEDFQYSIPECEGYTTITTVGGLTEYSKPSDFVRLTGLLYDSYNLSKITKQHFLMNRATESLPSSYYMYGDKIGLYPTPDAVYSLDLLYAKKLPKLTSVVDSELGEDMEDLVVLWACYLMFLSVEKQTKAGLMLTQYTIAKDALFGEKMYDDDNIRFGIERRVDRVRDDAL